MATLQAGGLLVRRYRLVDRIGAGGMSIIWRARDEVLDRMVAIKVLSPALAANARCRALVREEARAAAQLVHPRVTSVHDYGETVAPDGAVTAFVVMELLTGECLDSRLTAGPLPWAEAVLICAQVAEALAAAHRLGIVHRDVTTANIMMTATGVKVLDFGIATHIGAPDEDEDGETFGTPAYVAPERLDGTPAQPATDVYSVGVLLYETLTGQVPFPADTWDDLLSVSRVTPVQPLRQVPGLPPAVIDICLRCLAPDPAGRPSAHQVAAALREQLLPADPQAATMLAPTVTLPTVVAGPVAAGTGEPPGPRPGSDQTARRTAVGHARVRRFRREQPVGPRTRAAVLTGVSVTVLAMVLFAALQRSDRDREPQALPTGPTPELTTSAPAVPDPPAPVRDEATKPTPPVTTSRTRPGPVAGPQHNPSTVNAAVAELDQIITAGVATGDIRDDAGLDLRNYLRSISASVAVGPVDLTDPVAHLRQKVAIRVTEGAISTGYAQRLDAALVRLANAAV